ncbi:hypothetical protein KHS38_05285 [Mucilaginibacter sp. Bleaf8]|uniref:hypothetical protein n=1 Tax=Mucilaginibacter sp. Bleaf8 TaxID=2834430 RepID=UPI001BCF4885|nr:hypothetical protein [Mucilaginibacter sp. Bleaf8]MBS7563809.1 hypothetical protein [Mucilaginibacter sp. Bleaf8]
MAYYLGGYYLLKLRPVHFGTNDGRIIHSCSTCINDSLLDSWSYSWTSDDDQSYADIINSCQLNSQTIGHIQHWVDSKFDVGSLGWVNLFTELDTLMDYKQRFFSHLSDLAIMAIYFDGTAAEQLIDDFQPENGRSNSIGLFHNLSKKIKESITNTEFTIGYDIIGVELDGNFHTFHCHDLTAELTRNFGVQINETGLFDSIPNQQAIAEYLNNEENGFEPVPWFVVKVKQVVV